MTKSALQLSATTTFISLCILHPALGHYYTTDQGYPTAYATLYSNQYGMAYQQIWDDPGVSVVQVHPPTFHGKHFQKNLFPLWARHVGLAAGDSPLYTTAAAAAPAALSLLPLAPVAPYTYTPTYPLATAPAGDAIYSAYPPLGLPANKADTGAQIPGTSAAAPGTAVVPDAATAPDAAAAPGAAAIPGVTAAPGVAAVPGSAAIPDGSSDEKDALTTDATLDGGEGSQQTAATPTDAQGMAAPLSATPAGNAEADDHEPSVDSGASHNSPSFLGAPVNSTPVTVTEPEADGKRVVIYQFPNLLEGLVQRFQNYFSTYNHITATSVANAVANANANAVSNASSQSISNSISNSVSNSASNSASDSTSDSKSTSLSDSNSKSESDSNSNSLSGSNSVSGSNSGAANRGAQREEDGGFEGDVDPDGTGGFQSLEKQGQEDTTTGADSSTTMEAPTTSHPSVSSIHRHPPYLPPRPPPAQIHGYQQQRRPQRGPSKQWAVEPPQRSLSYEVHFTTASPVNGYRYNRPRLPFDPYREHYEQRQRSNQWRPIPGGHWNGPRFHNGPQGRSYNHRPRLDSHYYPSRI